MSFEEHYKYIARINELLIFGGETPIRRGIEGAVMLFLALVV